MPERMASTPPAFPDCLIRYELGAVSGLLPQDINGALAGENLLT